MKSSITARKSNSGAVVLIFLAWLVYTTSYLGKVNYSANITQIIDFYGVTKAQAGTAPTFFFFAYGIGQVFNGIFCKKYNIKWMIFLSAVVSAAINLAVAVTDNFSIIKWLWLLNGFALSVLWPTIIRLLSETLPQKLLGTSSVVMGTTVAIGTLAIYSLSSVFAAFNKFKLSFYTASVVVAVVSAVWLILFNPAVKLVSQAKAKDTQNTEEPKKALTQNKDNCGKKLFFATVFILCFYAVGVNLIKDGLTTWVPSILKDEFSMSDSLSILLTLFLPVLAVFGNAFALKIHKFIPDFVNHCFTAFTVIAIAIAGIIVSLSSKSVVFMLTCLVAANFLASSLNSLVTSIFPLFMRTKLNSGLAAGVLNGCCYIGSTVSSYGLGVIADNFGWTAVFFTLIAFCGVVFAVWLLYIFVKHKTRTEIIDIK